MAVGPKTHRSTFSTWLQLFSGTGVPENLLHNAEFSPSFLQVKEAYLSLSSPKNIYAAFFLTDTTEK